MELTEHSTLTLGDLFSIHYPTHGIPMSISSNGIWLATTIQGQFDEKSDDWVFTEQGVATMYLGSKVLLINTETGDTVEPFPGTSWAPRWSPDGTSVAAFVQDGGHACLGIYDFPSRKYRSFPHVHVRPYVPFESVHWLSDNKRLLVKQYTPKKVSDISEKMVSVFSYDPEIAEDTVSTNMGHFVGDLAIVDITTGESTALATGLSFTGIKISPDEKQVAIMHDVEMDMPRFRSYYDLMLFPLDGSPAVTVAHRVINEWGITFSWSPDSRYIAYSAGSCFEAGDLYLVPADGSTEPVNLSDGTGVNFASYHRPPYWSADGSTIYRQARQDIWSFPVDGSTPQKVTPAFPKDSRASWVLPEFGDQCVLSDLESVPFHFTQTDSREYNIAKVNLITGEVFDIAKISNLEPIHYSWGSALSADGSTSYEYLESNPSLPEIWRYDLKTKEMRCISKLNFSLDRFDIGSIRKIEWAAPTGKTVKGALLLPPGYQEGTLVPVVIEGYAGDSLSHQLDRVGQVGPFINPYILAARGYAVFYIDLPLEKENIRRNIGEMIECAADHLIDIGIADPDRLAIVGQSYGGYTALCAITHSPRFKAAIVSGAITNLAHLYGSLDSKGRSVNTGYCETGQGNIGGTVWEKLDRYIEESPFFHLDKVHTPVLLFAGSNDFIPNSQSKEIYVGLKRLGIPVTLRIYKDEHHAPQLWTAKAKRDFYMQVFKWLEKYLQ